MKICYIDESGGTEAPDDSPSATPVMVVAALFIDAENVKQMTQQFIELKRKHFGAKFTDGKALDHILTEVKGVQILSLTRQSSRNKRRQADKFRSELLDILDFHGAKMLGKVWVKSDGETLNPITTYCYAIQDIFKGFNVYLDQHGDTGMVIADSRDHKKNREVSHSIFTQKHRSGGDAYPRTHEVLTYAASDNHAGIQIADHLASSFILPMATAAFSESRPGATHQPDAYLATWKKFAHRIKSLQFRYKDTSNYWRGGLDISDLKNRQPGSKMFNPPTN